MICASCAPKTGGSTPAVDAHGADGSIAQAVSYHGTLAATSPPVQFGGTPFCMYSITLKSLDLSLAMQETGEVTAATMKNINVEAIVGTCQYTPTPPTAAMYTLASSKPISNGTELTFQGDPSNPTKVALTIDLVAAADSYMATAMFKRTDQADPLLAWVVTAKLNVSK